MMKQWKMANWGRFLSSQKGAVIDRIYVEAM